MSFMQVRWNSLGFPDRFESDRLRFPKMRIVPFSAENVSAVQRFSEKTWRRPRGDRYYRWRYRENPDLRGFLAIENDECLAAIFGFSRFYSIAGRRKACLETFDWYCLPEFKGSGLG